MCGFFQCSARTIEVMTHIPTAQSYRAFEKFEAAGKAVYDNGLMFVPQMAKHQHSEKLGYFHAHILKIEREFRKPGNRAYEAFREAFATLIATLPIRKKTKRKKK